MCSKIVSSKLNLVERHSFTWKIDNFSTARILGDGEVRSNLKLGSKIGLPYDCDWTCSLIRSPSSSYLNTLRIELSKKPISLKELNAVFRVQIKRRGTVVSFHYDSEASPLINVVEQNWACKLIASSSITNLPLDKNGNLEVVISIEMHSPKYKTSSEILANFQDKFTRKLQSDFANMLTASSLPRSDSPTEIVCKHDCIAFSANRGMLAARSNVFRRMFRSEMKEDRSGIVEVEDVSSKVMKIILHFLYTGTLLANWDTVNTDELLYAAAKYEVEDLLEFLDNVIGQVCTIDNAGKLMNLVKKLNLKRAERDLFNFIKSSAETFEQFEKIMNDAKSDICFVRLFSANCVIQPAKEGKKEEVFNDCFEEIDSDEVDLPE